MKWIFILEVFQVFRSGRTLSIAAIVNALVESIVGIFRLGFAAVKGVVKAVRTFAKFVVKSIRDLINGFQEMLNFLKKGWSEIRNIFDDMFKALETYAKDSRGSLNSQIPLLGPAELKLYGNLLKAFFKPFGKLLLKYADVLLLMKKWKQLNPMKDLDKKIIEELLYLRKLNKKGFNKNAAIMNAEVEINGRIMNLEYKALAGDGVNGIGLCSNVNKDYVAKQLGMSVDELMEHYKTVDEYNKIVARFHDSEHKIFSVFDDELLKLRAKFGENAVKVKSMNIKTLYEPCNSCKKQIIIRHEMYNEAKVSVEATLLKKGEYVKGNRQLESLGY